MIRLKALWNKSMTRQTKFVYLNDFVKFLPGTNFVGGAFEVLSASAKNCQVATNHPHL